MLQYKIKIKKYILSHFIDKKSEAQVASGKVDGKVLVSVSRNQNLCRNKAKRTSQLNPNRKPSLIAPVHAIESLQGAGQGSQGRAKSCRVVTESGPEWEPKGQDWEARFNHAIKRTQLKM